MSIRNHSPRQWHPARFLHLASLAVPVVYALAMLCYCLIVLSFRDDLYVMFLPYAVALAACGAAISQALSRRWWLLGLVMTGCFVALLAFGYLNVPLSLAECEEWVQDSIHAGKWQ